MEGDDRADRAVERILPATKDWRERAEAAFAARGRGAKAECARDLGKDQAHITRVLSGEIGASEVVSDISDWLKIAPPAVPVRTMDQVAMVELTHDMDEADLRDLLKVAERYVRRLP